MLLELGAKNGWEFTFSKDGSLFTPEYLAQFDTVMFYSTIRPTSRRSPCPLRRWRRELPPTSPSRDENELTRKKK